MFTRYHLTNITSILQPLAFVSLANWVVLDTIHRKNVRNRGSLYWIGLTSSDLFDEGLSTAVKTQNETEK